MRHRDTETQRRKRNETAWFFSLIFSAISVSLWPILVLGCGGERATAVPSTKPQPQLPPRAQLIHVPGIGGHMRIDDSLIAGLRDGGIDAEIQIYDWTGPDRGLVSLGSTTRHASESAKVAEMITSIARADPRRKIILTGHSGGAAIVVWALEKLPNDVHIDTLLMMQPALSPSYDLNKALSRVRGHAYSLYSVHDPVLGPGTRLLGTMDRVRTEAAGAVGFTDPPNAADHAQYQKLTQFEYQDSWMRYGDIGDHIGPMRRSFAKNMLAPLLLTGKLPQFAAPATTLTATTRSSS
jgi:pimeloyl-ACP methyl ester carboxylesterase